MDSSGWSTYRRVNVILGWLVFVFSAIIYIVTLEPTVSFWDCGEFILSGFRLQVGHPPGAPVFLMISRIASLFAGGDVTKVAFMANMLSALCSAFTIMFLFWSVTHIVRKIYTRNGDFENKHIIAIMGAGLLGALTYTFTDTFWFSAVEGELYAMSSLCTALVFWAMLKWEDEADTPSSGRWIVLIAYIMGLGLGIHRLNLLVLPVIVLIFYFRKYEFSWKGFVKTLLLAVFLLASLVFVLIPGVPKVAGWFELLFVNVLGLPYNTGLFAFILLAIAGLVFGIRYSIKKNKVILNYVITCFTVIMIGYSSYAMIVIRSSARPPMNQNNPSNIFALSYYINMEQYGSAPKLFGEYYCAPVIGNKNVIAGYNKLNGRYEPYYKPEYTYSKEFETVFPRMYSSQEDHIKAYQYWGKVRGRKYTVTDASGEKETIVCPTFMENLRFFFRYQVGFMYFRYFMWNFAGRQNDIQGNGNNMYGNWISGIKFIDEARLGDMDGLPQDLKDNPGNNKYYMIPLLLGILGLLWHYKRDGKDFIVVLAFFIMTGLAIILYLNQYPNQPRERDYAYAGSFYAFSIWIGLGFMPLYELLKKKINCKVAACMVLCVVLLSCPLVMAVENWDDHDRSDRYTARDIGANYLNTCDSNAILFTYGDNDSFPLWYIQDVEDVRTDVRVVNLSYFQAEWYINMMRQKALSSDPLPLSMPPEKYVEGTRTQLFVIDKIKEHIDIRDIVDFATKDAVEYKVPYGSEYFNYLPASKFKIDVDSATVLSNGTVKPYFKDRLLPFVIWKYSSSYAFKGDLAMMDLLGTNKWKRPIYIATTVPSSQYKGLEKFFVQEGLAYRISPVKIDNPEQGNFGMIDPDVMYENMVNKFTWGNVEKPGVYLDETNRRMFCNYRNMYGELGKTLLAEGDTARAVVAALKGLDFVPPEKMPYDYFILSNAEVLIRAGEIEKGEEVMKSVVAYSEEYMKFISRFGPLDRFGLDYTIGVNMQALVDIYRISSKWNRKELTGLVEPLINEYYPKFFSH